MRTEDLIVDLASQAGRVRPLPAPATRAASWLAVAVVFSVLGVLVFRPRPGLADLMTSADFFWTAVVIWLTCAFAATATLVLAIPGAERSAVRRAVTLVLIGLWAATLIVAIVEGGHGLSAIADWPICFVRVVAIGLVPGVVLFAMLRRAAPLRLAWTSGLAAMAAMATGAVAIQFICPLTDPGHALMGHFGPVISLGVLAAASARRLLARR